MVPIVLAAGQSRRMGRPKALLDFDGETGISLVLRACCEGGAASPLVVLGADAEAIASTLPPEVVWCFNPRHRETGPAASLQAGLRCLPQAWSAILLFPVDFPLVTGRDVAAVLAGWEETRHRGCRIVVPSHGMRRGHPALLGRELLPELMALGPDTPVRHLMRRRREEIHHVVVDNPGVLRDVNTPEDHQAALAEYRRHRA